MPRKPRNQSNKPKIRFGPMTNRPMGNPQSLIAPNEFDVRLKFVDQLSLTSVGAFANYSVNPNCPYDVDPAFGSTSTAGFAELAALYQFQRTTAYSYKLSCINLTGVYAQFTVINVNVTPPATAFYGLAGNQYSQTETANVFGGADSIAKFSATHSVAQIVGSRTPETADSFASLTNNVPTDKIWLGVSMTNLNGAACLATVMLQLEMWIRFYERKNLSS
jgi:hypothetical protein